MNRRIETTAAVDENRRITLQLPSDVEPGEHRVIVLLEEPDVPEDEPTEQPLVRKGNVLVYAGTLLDDPGQVLKRLREERLQRASGQIDQ